MQGIYALIKTLTAVIIALAVAGGNPTSTPTDDLAAGMPSSSSVAEAPTTQSADPAAPQTPVEQVEQPPQVVGPTPQPTP
ncbi:MAG: hypothetical protein ACRDQZ_24360, partial [Mycobacteriales bacterium]